jgi:hypothetical protein
MTSDTYQNIEVIDEDGAPSGRKDFIIWSPPLINSRAPSLGRNHTLSEATGLMRYLMRRGIRVILFCKVCPFCYFGYISMPEFRSGTKGLRIGTSRLVSI